MRMTPPFFQREDIIREAKHRLQRCCGDSYCTHAIVCNGRNHLRMDWEAACLARLTTYTNYGGLLTRSGRQKHSCMHVCNRSMMRASSQFAALATILKNRTADIQAWPHQFGIFQSYTKLQSFLNIAADGSAILKLTWADSDTFSEPHVPAVVFNLCIAQMW